MSDQLPTKTALVLFSGGQDSATCLAWALQRFARVEMLGFNYGQRHAIELECRGRLLDGMKLLRADWAAKLGESHTLEIPTLATISDTALNLGMAKTFELHTPLMWLDKGGTWKLAYDLGGAGLVDVIREHSHTCYLGERGAQHAWGYGCGECPACALRARGWQEYAGRDPSLRAKRSNP